MNVMVVSALYMVLTSPTFATKKLQTQAVSLQDQCVVVSF